MSGTVSKIKYAMSLRTPQEEALSYLDAISTHCDYKRDDKETIEAAASEYSENNRKVRTKFDFPSFGYNMATGIGKTRLMGACIYYLYKTKGYKHFFILAPETPSMTSCAMNPTLRTRSTSSRGWKLRWADRGYGTARTTTSTL